MLLCLCGCLRIDPAKVLPEEIVLDMAMVTHAEYPGIEEELLDFGVVGPGPRRALNFINNRRWFDNEQDRSPAAENMYMQELRAATTSGRKRASQI